MPETDASTVRMRDGKAQITDGPFAETKETLGGYYLLECADLDEALKWGPEFHLQNTAVLKFARPWFLISDASRTRAGLQG